MEPQMPRPHVDQNYDHEHLPPSVGLPPPSVTEGEEDEQHHHHHHHQEKKSVLKKVKAKAKKIKETLTKHGHGHDHEHEHDYHQRHHIDEEEEDEDEDEMVEDSEVHGAPMYESDTIRSGVNLGKPMTVVGEDHRYDSKLTTEPPPTRPFENSGPPPIANVTRRSTAVEGSESESTGNFVDIKRRGGNTGIKMGTSTALEEDPRAPPQMSNYHTKVTHPNAAPGGEEAGITPILQSFKKMNVYDNDEEPESKPKPQGAANLYTGSHDRFSPEPLPLHTRTDQEGPGSVLKRFDATKPEDMPRDTFSKQPSDQSSGYTYTEKISSATSAIADKAITAKNVVASKLLGYGSNEDTTSTSTSTKNTRQGDEETTDKAEYGHKIAAALTEKLAPMYEKVTDVGNSVMSKVHNTCTDTDTSTGQERGDRGQDGVSVKEYLVKKLRPSEEDKLLSEMISDALHKRKQEVVEEKPMGKVTESEEVARRLGNTSRGSSDEDSSSREGTAADSGKAVAVAVVDRLKGAISTWFFSGRDQSQTSQPSLAHAGQEQMSSSTGEEVGYVHGQDDGVGDR
ncbi:low-temperature-induced 65 kDa protein isoform X1 [Camellia sinensis]|uniref:Low-temperature-induced 65 kDa protein n=1 Tax=Camellia sinensis var. sinensis TaxID=542762 RepID=A0A4S4DHZ8_CAMSN|nr:low-temperature-induced 65 kDa protein isoform X1 [Camellia sinensis]THG01536.1 hypothetical protein TEA_020792 [Camellia sinensis var. sinensis]